MTGNPLDLMFIVIIVVFALMAAINGFIKEAFSKIAFIGAIIVAVIFTNMLKLAFYGVVKNTILSAIIAFLILFIGTFLIIKIIQEIFAKIFSKKILKSLDHALGFLFGIVEGLAIVAVIMLVFIIQPWFDTSAIFEGSLFYNYLAPIISGATQTVKGLAA